MVLELEVEAQGFALYLHVDRPPVEVLAGLMGCYNAIAGELDQLSDLSVRCYVDKVHVDGSTPVEALRAGVTAVCSKLEAGDQVAPFLHALLVTHGFTVGKSFVTMFAGDGNV